MFLPAKNAVAVAVVHDRSMRRERATHGRRPRRKVSRWEGRSAWDCRTVDTCNGSLDSKLPFPSLLSSPLSTTLLTSFRRIITSASLSLSPFRHNSLRHSQSQTASAVHSSTKPRQTAESRSVFSTHFVATRYVTDLGCNPKSKILSLLYFATSSEQTTQS